MDTLSSECILHEPKGDCESMVIIHYRKKNSSEWIREYFLNPQHYMKWREVHKRRIADIRPVRSKGVSSIYAR